MARNFTLQFPATSWIGDSNAQLVAGDAAAPPEQVGPNRAVLSFDDTAEEAAVTHEFEMPAEYTGTGTLKADVHFFMASDATNDVAIDIFVEAKTPNTDTLDMEAASSWDTANSGTKSVGGTTAGDPLTLTITLSNKDSVAAGDTVRLGIRRDTDSANDDATGDMYVSLVVLYEE